MSTKLNINPTTRPNSNPTVNAKSTSTSIPNSIINSKINLNTENYINCIDSNRQKLYFHLVITIVASIVYSTLPTTVEVLYNWISHLCIFLGLLYCVCTGIYLIRIINRWDVQLNDGFIKFRDACINLSIKNYRLLKEYREVYHFHYNDILKQCISKYKTGEIKGIGGINGNDASIDDSLNSYVNFVLCSDPTEKLETDEWMKHIIDRINRYIKLCYYLSFLKRTDQISIDKEKIFVNIVSESILNKRNRKLESTMNCIPLDYKNELVNTWNTINSTNTNDLMIVLPCKWIVYEYRNMFRYLYCAKYFKQIHNVFDKDYQEIENIVKELVHHLQKLFSKDEALPDSFKTFYSMLSEVLIFMLDNFIALTLAASVFTGSFLVPIIIGLITHTIMVCTIGSVQEMIDTTTIKNLINCTQDLESVDGRIETIFEEMRIILFDTKKTEYSAFREYRLK